MILETTIERLDENDEPYLLDVIVEGKHINVDREVGLPKHCEITSVVTALSGARVTLEFDEQEEIEEKLLEEWRGS